MGRRRVLHSGWTLAAASGGPVGPVPATVPGCVHTDLLAAGLIPDPYLDDNEARLAWIGRADWVYSTVFSWDGSGDDRGSRDDRVDLAFDGLDTVAAVSLNGTEVGRTANMHRSYRFDVRELLRPGANRLAVRFDSAYRYAESVRDLVGPRPSSYPEPFQYIRKMACNFGWDWGPTLVTAGIWQPVALHGWSTARLAEVRPLTTVDGRVEVHVTVERATSGPPLTVTAAVAGQRASVSLGPGESRAVVTVTVPDPVLWWPRGYGEPARYPLTVTLHSGPSTLDGWERLVGFRSIRLSEPFGLVVNDVPIPVRGVNWIPDDAFVTRVDRARYAARLAQAVDAGVNYVRVWGGGRYESDDFYDLADSLGLLVGQDFLFACAAYPEEEPLAAEVAAEAREQVSRLAPHPSLVLWVGGNETVWGFHDWGWEPELAGRTWGLGYYERVLPAIVAELDPTRVYLPNSPYSGDGRHPNDPDHGTTHVWDVWNTHDYTHYRSYRPRFVGEFGFQGPPAYATLRRAGQHQKAHDGDAKLRRGLRGHLPEPAGFDDWHWATQLNQARAVRFGVEHFRSLRPYCTGTIVWQLNDCWPVVSWSTVDGDGRRKPLWYALRRAYAVRLLTFQPRPGGLALVAVNDSATSWSSPVRLSRSTVDGRELASSTVDVSAPPGDATTVAVPPDVAEPGDPTAELLTAELLTATAGGVDRAVWFFVEDVDLAVPPPVYEVAVDGPVVTVTARTLLRDLALFPDRLDPAAEVDDALVTLLPGESARFAVSGGRALDPAALAGPPVLRCARDLLP